MLNKIKKIFSNILGNNKKEITALGTEQDMESYKNAPPLISKSEKRAVMVFDKKRRVFVTKTKYSTIALFCPVKKQFHIRKQDGTVQTIVFNPLNNDEFAYPVAGDWKGIGNDGIGLYYPKTGLALLKNSIDNINKANLSIDYGIEGEYIPLAGNWKGDGVDSLCFYYKEKSTFLFPEKKPIISEFRFGARGKNYIPISGDWNNSGCDAIGLYEPESSLFRLKNTLEGNKADLIFPFLGGDSINSLYPISGNWEGEANDSVGLYDKTKGVFILKNNLMEKKFIDSFKTDFKNLIPLEISLLA